MPSALDLISRNQALQDHWIRRIFAIVIDGILLTIVVAIVSVLAWPVLWANFWLSTFLWGIFALVYFTLFEASSGATIGKKLLSLRVVALDAPLDASRALIRNISKLHGLLLFLDVIVGGVTQGDPRQRYMDRIARTTVTRVDQHAYMEEQFRQMQHAPPYPQAPPAGGYPPSQAPPPGGVPPATPAAQAPPAGWPQQTGGWPGQAPPQSEWPKHEWDEEGRLKPQMRFCTQCGGQLVARGDGKMTCVRCGTVY